MRKIFATGAPSARSFRWPVTLAAYLLLAYFVGVYAQEIAHGGQGFKTGDWLINYEAGWVRRGLLGQGLYELSRLGVNLLWATFALQTLIYVATAHLVLKLFFSVERSASWLLLLFSPAFLFLFPFYDTGGGFRKEIIVFLAFALLAVGLVRDGLSHKYAAAALLFYAVAAFSHEQAALCVLFFVCLLEKASSGQDQATRQACRWYQMGFLAAGAAGLLFALAYPGNWDVANGVCGSLIRRGADANLCIGAVAWLSLDTAYAYRFVAENARNWLPAYSLLFALTMIPVLLSGWWRERWPLIIGGFASLLPLYVVGTDWGRWIHIYAFLIFVSLLFDSCRRPVRLPDLPVLAVLAYVGLWSIPHTGGATPVGGLAEFIYHFLSP